MTVPSAVIEKPAAAFPAVRHKRDQGAAPALHRHRDEFLKNAPCRGVPGENRFDQHVHVSAAKHFTGRHFLARESDVQNSGPCR